MELATVLNKSMDDYKHQNKINFIKNGFVRKAEPADFEREKQLEVKAQSAKEVILRVNKELGIKMKIIKVKYTLDDSKAIFYFSANGRVDFRELIKRLAYELKRRIEMRQIGVRDTTKIMGGLGPCGRALCCRKHMHNFIPVSIKMAKDQNFSLNPNKISGICGRLFCCLGYENATYEELRKDYPQEETAILDRSSNRKGYVKKVNAIGENITVFFPENPEKKEKAEEKIFPKSALEFNNGWFINLPQNDSSDRELENITPIVAKEKEILRETANPENSERTERPQQNQNSKKPLPRDPNTQNPNNKKNPNWHGNRKNFKKFPPRKDNRENQEVNKE